VPLARAESADACTEGYLQDLLYRHPRALPIAEIDESFMGRVPVCREMETPVGPVDVVYVTPSARSVILEAKLWRNPEARRKVIVAQTFLNRPTDVQSWAPIVEQIKPNTGDQARELSAGAAYCSEGNLAVLVCRHINACIATRRQRRGTASATGRPTRACRHPGGRQALKILRCRASQLISVSKVVVRTGFRADSAVTRLPAVPVARS
jgi:hypothetical protein